MDIYLYLFLSIACLIKLTVQVDAEYCYYNDGQTTQYYYCGSYEYCCSEGCCENFITFYRLWYFWFAIVSMLLFCTGGGYWYHRRYIQQRLIISQAPASAAVISMAPANHDQSTAVYITPSNSFAINTTATDNPPTYSQVCHPGAHCPYPVAPQSGSLPVNTNAVVYQTAPYGPPPSYDSIQNTHHDPPTQPTSS